MVASVAELSGAFLLELQHAPECRHFALRRGELLVQVVKRAMDEGLRLAEMTYLFEGQIPEEVGHGAVL